MNYDKTIDALEARIARLEAFILRDQEGYVPAELTLEHESLESIIRSTVQYDFYVTTEARLVKNWKES